jgi:hypothetical protein
LPWIRILPSAEEESGLDASIKLPELRSPSLEAIDAAPESLDDEQAEPETGAVTRSASSVSLAMPLVIMTLLRAPWGLPRPQRPARTLEESPS